MSASLVGSEMCIRDSCTPLGALWSSFLCTPTPLSPGGLPPASAAAASAVSYTHLTLPTICSV
eukprot:9472224-Alexandrium_andersonii.AAC.1